MERRKISARKCPIGSTNHQREENPADGSFTLYKEMIK
ncbi:hypothetical protein B4064_1497 [Caldibacillus thermoamylovorans]|uniref:Uncharacterized protein n=1 Tax=Caldibacillus thermoamylovorans TaxID=35841 RepID=A0ABD4A1N1_9BACI|nr:hypothetical protein B4166_0759 [Caldibacillus thermoamylovorans]KIO68852.1 hypothetical protein B4064_1497 [Caldibacillus thermoamylovorans]KIO70104.1 hypothetical protein B4167_0794 [Caldibacillus thermoamylovorans]